LTFASTHGHLESVELLIQSGADINALSVSPERFTPAMYAAVMGHAEVLQTLLSHGAKFEGVSADGDTILELAMARGHLATTKILLEALGGPDYPKDSIALQMATAPSKTGLRPVMTAVSTMYRYINSNPTNAEGLGWIRWVLDEGGELVRSRAMCNMLYAAIMDRDPGVVAELLRLGADPNMAGFIGFTPLHSSVDTGNLEVIKTLLAVGADPAKLSKHTGRGCGVTPLDCAISRFGFDSEEDTAVIDMLLASGRCKVMKGEEALSTAFACVVSEFDGESGAVARDLAFRMLDSILDVNDHRSEDGSTLMHVAVHYNQKDLIDALRRKGADINAGDKDGLSPLLAACRMDVERVNFLITRCANVSAVTKHGQGALHIAAECGQVEVLRFLLDLDLADEESLDINAVDDAGYTPLIVAIVESQEDTALFLLERGASVSQRTADTGRLALHYAAQASMKRVVEKILEELEIKTEMGLKLDC
jgi:ankyrin repeat protein